MRRRGLIFLCTHHTLMNTFQKIQPLLFVFLALAISLLFWLWPHNAASRPYAKNLEGFAACLTEKGVVMYGNDRCINCEVQKKMFAAAFSEINYVNCDFQKDVCDAKNVLLTPTWVWEDKRAVGMQSFGQLAEMSGCVAPGV